MNRGILKEIAKTIVDSSLLLEKDDSNSSGFLYHYSKDKYDEILSRNAQGIVTKEELKKEKLAAKFRNDPGLDCDSVSLFFEPIPYDIISGVFKNKNPHWKSGQKLFEHKVRISDIEDCPWTATSTPYQLSLIDFIEWNDKTPDDYKRKYFRVEHESRQLAGDESDNTEDLKKCQKRYKGFTRKMYEEVPGRSDFSSIVKQYAGAVVHLIIYPYKGKIKVNSVKEIVIK